MILGAILTLVGTLATLGGAGLMALIGALL